MDKRKILTELAIARAKITLRRHCDALALAERAGDRQTALRMHVAIANDDAHLQQLSSELAQWEAA